MQEWQVSLIYVHTNDVNKTISYEREMLLTTGAPLEQTRMLPNIGREENVRSICRLWYVINNIQDDVSCESNSWSNFSIMIMIHQERNNFTFWDLAMTFLTACTAVGRVFDADHLIECIVRR